MNADSVKTRLKNFAISSGCTFQEALVYYGLERTIYRISVSQYASHFILKGGIFLYAIFDRKYERATTDVDLLARRISNSAEEMKVVFRDIFAQDTNDALNFDLNSITVEDITEFKEYHGLHISAVAYLDRTRIPIGIDIGFGDVIYPNAVEIEFPVILDMEVPRVNAYSLESSIAEKLEAIVKNGFLNSRYKDFYDIYVLSEKFPFNYEELHNAVKETFTNRKTPITIDTAAFGNEFLGDAMHQNRWNSFLKKKKALIPVSMNDAMTRIKIFVTPLLTQIIDPITEWDPNKGCWK
jgi:predicted nucleotidyltransferase component of viral defense system